MKKQKNATRIIAIVLVLLMALALIPFAASAEAAPTEGECTIIFDGNGGTTGGESPQTQVYTMGETPALTANPFSRVGYSFDGWNTQADGLGSSVPANATVAALNTLNTWVDSTITLYAKWTPILTIVYATTVSGQESVTRTYDAQCTALPTAGALGFTNENHEFVKWQVEGSVDQPEAGDSYPASPVTEPTTYNLTTIWAHLYTVTFNVNGGTGSPAPSTQRDGFNVTFPATGTVTRTGYILKGWSESQNANPDDASALVNPGTYSKTADVTLYAIWKADPVTINYLSNGGSGNMDSDTILRNTDYPVLDNGFTAPAKHKFVCWKDEDHGNKTYDPSKNELLDWTTIGSEEAVVNLTAQWAQLRNVKFYSTTVTVSGYPKTVVVVDGATLGSAFSDGKLPSPTSTDYNFLGWYDNASCAGDPVTADLVIADADKQLFAKWISKTIPVTFDAGGGSGTMAADKAPRDGEYTLPDNGFQPPLAEMAFVGWKIGATDVIKVPGEKVSTVGYGDTGLPLTAQWRDNAVTVTFDPNGGTATGGVKTQRMYRESASALSQFSTLSFTPPANKVFAGWSRTAAGDVQFADGESVQWNGSSGAKNYAETSTVTLYAKWQEKLAGSVAVTKGGSAVSTDTTFKTGDTVTATATVTAPSPTPSPLYYRWVDAGSGTVLASGQVNGTSANYEVKAADLGKDVQVLFCTNNSFTADNTILSNVFTLNPDVSETITLTVKVVGAEGNSAATVNGSRTADATTPEITINDIVKGADVTLALTADDAQQVKSVMKGTEAQPLDRMTYTMQFTAAATVTVTFEPKGAHTNPRAVVNIGGTIPPTAQSAIIAIAGSNPCCVYDVVPCWNGVISNPITDPSDIPAAGLGFTLPYPAGSGKVASTGKDISSKMDQYYTVRAWHWNGTAYELIPATRVKGNPLLASGITVTGQKDFSPMAADLTPIPLAGTVKLSGLVSDTTSGATAAVGKTLTASFTPSGPEVVGKLTYRWEYKDGTEWKLLATGESYTPTKSYRGWDLRCVATSDFETEPTTGWPNKAFKIIDKPNPEWHRDAVNNGGVQTGIVKNVTSDMMWSGPSSSKPGTTATWHTIAGTTFEVEKQGYYWVRFADDINCNNVSDAVYVANYFTVICHPNSVSGGRLYFEATTTGTSAEVHSDLKSHPDVVYDKYNSNHYWIREGGKGITVYAKTTNSKYYKITSITAYPTETSSFKKTGKADQLYVTIGSSYTYQPYEVVASAGVYGSKTGDTSHLELWVELAALSLMGLGAALVIARKKLKAQK